MSEQPATSNDNLWTDVQRFWRWFWSRGWKLKGPVIGVVVIVVLSIIGAAAGGDDDGATPASADDDPTATQQADGADDPDEEEDPTSTPEPTATAEPTDTPAPTATPIPTSTPTPIPTPIVITGSGADVVDIEPGDVRLLRVTGNAGGRYFGVEGFDENGDTTDLFVNTTDPFSGVVALDFAESDTTTRLQVDAIGDWTIEILPISEARILFAPGALTGAGPDVLLVIGESDTAHIAGNAEGRYFGVTGWSDRSDLMVNTTDPFDGRVVVRPSTVFIVVDAIGEWTITLE